MKDDNTTIEASSGNVFADLNCSNPDEKLVNAKITVNINRIIGERHLTQTAAAKLLGIDQPTVSKLLNGQLSGFSTDRLLRFLTALNQDIEIRIKPAADQKDQAQVCGTISVING